MKMDHEYPDMEVGDTGNSQTGSIPPSYVPAMAPIQWPFLLGPHMASYLTIPGKGKVFPLYYVQNGHIPYFQHHVWQMIHPLGMYFVPQSPYYPDDCEWDD